MGQYYANGEGGGGRERIDERIRVDPRHWRGPGEEKTTLPGQSIFSLQYQSALCPQTRWGLWIRVDSSGDLGQAHQRLLRVPVVPMPKVAQPG